VSSNIGSFQKKSECKLFLWRKFLLSIKGRGGGGELLLIMVKLPGVSEEARGITFKGARGFFLE
jgi:hypothetical protein